MIDIALCKMECELVKRAAVEKHARLFDQCRRKPPGAGCLEDVNEPVVVLY